VSDGRHIAVDRLKHMRAATDAIDGYVSRGRAEFDRDPAVKDAILYQIVVLGESAEAVLKADPTMESEIPEVEWSPIVRMRGRVSHHYWSTDSEVIWTTASVAVGELRKALVAALERLHSSF
jgi:uncharacterized protein with HEPN domain